jgi:hypothetical protein
VIDYLDAVASGNVEPPELTRAEQAERWKESISTNDQAFAVLIASRRTTFGLRARDDWEKLLRTSREVWGDAPQEQGMLCNPWAAWQTTVATQLRFGSPASTLEGVLGHVGTAAMRLVGARIDVRDAESIARDYLEHGKQALRDVPSQYRRRVAEKILDLQEAGVDGEDELMTIRTERDDRRRALLLDFDGRSPRQR